MEHKGQKLVNVDGADVEVPAQTPGNGTEKEEAQERDDPNLQLLIERMKKVIRRPGGGHSGFQAAGQHSCRLVYKGEENDSHV